MTTISIREFCIPAYDWLCRIRRVQSLPQQLEMLEEKTAGGICSKVKQVLESEYFMSLPNVDYIKSGMVDNYRWVKQEQLEEALRISSAIK